MLSKLLHPVFFWWRFWRFKQSLIARNLAWCERIEFPELRDIDRNSAPRLAPYERLASVYDQYLTGLQYAPLLRHYADAFDLRLKSILDLGCGTGARTVELTDLAANVVGVDVSPAMIARARARGAPGCRFIQADFTQLALGEAFDAAVCATDAVNYLGNRDELLEFLQGAHRHLQPGGLLLFDALTRAGMMTMAGRYLHVAVDDVRCVLCFAYDARNQVDETRVLFADGIEVHRRIAIDIDDIEAAAARTGFAVVEWLALDRYRHCYVLRHQPAS